MEETSVVGVLRCPACVWTSWWRGLGLEDSLYVSGTPGGRILHHDRPCRAGGAFTESQDSSQGSTCWNSVSSKPALKTTTFEPYATPTPHEWLALATACYRLEVHTEQCHAQWLSSAPPRASERLLQGTLFDPTTP